MVFRGTSYAILGVGNTHKTRRRTAETRCDQVASVRRQFYCSARLNGSFSTRHFFWVLPLFTGGCTSESAAWKDRSDEPPTFGQAESDVSAVPLERAVKPSLPAQPSPPPTCPPDMRLVQGNYCPAPEQTCLEWNQVNVRGEVERNQCKRYRQPSQCYTSRTEPMRFCMDTYEWPNEKGAMPRNLTTWQEANDACVAKGKRLCSDVEFTFACEGEAMRPHVTGWERDGTKCSYDRPYIQRKFYFTRHDACAADPICRVALQTVDQRVPAGSMSECVSPEGVHDLNGNVNEWVALPNHGLGKRAGLKGGWWGPVRDRCRPITTYHGESDFGYEVGFRCCADAPAVEAVAP